MTRGPQGSARLRFWLGVAFLFGGLAVGTIGFYLSFGNLSTAAHEKFAFAPGKSSVLFALGVDATIVVCLVGDLMFATRGRAFWLLRPVAGAFTALTIYLNATAHSELLKAVPHAAMPVVFVALVEAARHYLVMEAALEMGIGRDPIPWHRWIMHPIQTGGIFRVMKTWEMTYTQVRTQRRELAVYRVWLEHRAEIEKGLEAGQLGVLDRLPVLLAPHGVPVDDALALPARMQRAEHKRIQKQEREALELRAGAERHARDLEHRAALEVIAAEEKRLEAAGELAELRARVTGQEKVAVAQAEGATAAAELTAQKAVAAVRRAATAEERQAMAEDAAEETQRIAEARRRTAEADAATAEIERAATEDAARIAAARAKEAAAKADQAEADQRTAKAAKRIAEDRQAAAETADRAAETELRAAEKLERAAEMKAGAVLTAEQRQAELEEATVETERTAQARRKAAEDTAATAEIERTTAEEAARTATAKAAQARAQADQEAEKARAAAAAKAAATARQKAAEAAEAAQAAELRTAQVAQQAAQKRAHAAQAEALADLTPVQIRTRVVARLLLASPDADGAAIAAALGGGSPAKASSYKKAAQDLIAQGYPDTDPDLTTATPVAAPVTIPGQTVITV